MDWEPVDVQVNTERDGMLYLTDDEGIQIKSDNSLESWMVWRKSCAAKTLLPGSSRVRISLIVAAYDDLCVSSIRFHFWRAFS